MGEKNVFGKIFAFGLLFFILLFATLNVFAYPNINVGDGEQCPNAPQSSGSCWGNNLDSDYCNCTSLTVCTSCDDFFVPATETTPSSSTYRTCTISDSRCCPSATYYQDADLDGRGNLHVSSYTCPQPSGYVSNSNDCNDSNPRVYLNAPELCDGLDNDCDRVVDNGAGMTCTNLGINCITAQNPEKYRYCNCSTCVAVPKNIAPRVNPNGPYFGYKNVALDLNGVCSDSDGVVTDCDWAFSGLNCSILSQQKSGINSANASSRASVSCFVVGAFDFNLTVVDNNNAVSRQGAVVNINEPNNSFAEIVNTAPSTPSATLVRTGSYGDNNLECNVGGSIDPDVFPAPPLGGQVLNYFARIYEEGASPGDFFPAVPLTGGKYSIPLLRERNYCCDVNVFEGIESAFNSTCSSALKCTGAQPLDGNIILGGSYFEGGAPLREWTFKAVPLSVGDCEWSCKPCYVKSGNTCVLSPSVTSCCVSGLPDGFGITDSGVLASLLIPPVSKDWNFIFNTNNYQDPNFLNACEWSCAPGFNKVVDSNSCESLCRGTKPVGSDDQGVIVSTKVSPVSKDWNYAFGKSVFELEACEWSCADKYERFENTCVLKKTPFVPTSIELGFDAELISFTFLPNGKTQLTFRVFANKKTQGFEAAENIVSRISFSAKKIARAFFVYASDKISVESIKFKKSDNTIVGGRITGGVDDVSEIPQTLIAEMDSNALGSYSAELTYGGIFNGVSVTGVKQVVFTLATEEQASAIPDANLLVAILALIVVISVISFRKK